MTPDILFYSLLYLKPLKKGKSIISVISAAALDNYIYISSSTIT